MSSVAVFKTSLDLLYYSGTAAALRPFFAGQGAIFMLHHVRPAAAEQGGFAPNSGLEVTPDFLDAVITFVAERGYDLVSLDEAARRLTEGGAPFACFTLDDGYRDNLHHAQPVFGRHGCPYTIYVAPAIADGTCELWWLGLEAAIARNASVAGSIEGNAFALRTEGPAGKQQAWKRLYWPVRSMEQHAQRRWIRDFCAAHGVDLDALCRAAAMGWDDVRTIADDPLCTIGAHTIHHFNVKALSADEAVDEMAGSAERIAAETGRWPRHFAYPYGDGTSAGPREFELAAAAGFTTAVTTRKGMLFPAHRDHLTALPRFSLAGDFQKLRHVETLLTGVPFALFNGFRAVNVA